MTTAKEALRDELRWLLETMVILQERIDPTSIAMCRRLTARVDLLCERLEKLG